MIAKRGTPSEAVGLFSLVEQALVLCQQLEKGQAASPLSEAFQALQSTCRNHPLHVAVLSLDSRSHSAIEAQLGICAADASNADSDAGETVRWKFASCRELAKNSNMYQQFVTSAHVVMVVGAEEAVYDSDVPGTIELNVVRDVAAIVPLVWPIVISTANAREALTATSETWLSQLTSSIKGAILPVMTIARDQEAASGREQFAVSLSTHSETLVAQRHARVLLGAVQKVTSRCQHEMKHLKNTQTRLEQSAKTQPARGVSDCEKEVLQVREQFADRMGAVERQLTLKSDRAVQPLGELSGMMRSIATSLNVEDLEKGRTSSSLKLSVNASHLARINRRIEYVLRQDFTSDLQQVERCAQQFADEATDVLSGRVGEPIQIKFAALDVNHAWRSVENLMAIGKEAHIELARKGFFDVLTAGRQKVFIIIMFMSLMGRMGLPNLFATPASKTGFGLFLGIVMVSSMIHAVLNWRREKLVQSEKEMTKIRDTLLADGTKVIEQVEKAKLTAMRDYIKEASRYFDVTIKQTAEEAASRSKAKREANQQKQEAMRKSLDSRIKTVSEIERQLGRLGEQATQLCSTTMQATRDWVRAASLASHARNIATLALPVDASNASLPAGCSTSTVAPRESTPQPALARTPAAIRPVTRERASSSALAERRAQRAAAAAQTTSA